MNMSRITQYEFEFTTNISSQAKQIKYCHGENIKDTNDTLRISVIPGEEFSIQVIALDQVGSPVIANFLVRTIIIQVMIIVLVHQSNTSIILPVIM